MFCFRFLAPSLILALPWALPQEPPVPAPSAVPEVTPEAAPEDPAGTLDEPAAEAAPEPEPISWLGRLVANTELGFTARSAALARRDLDSETLTKALRATALMGLGCSEAWPDRGRLESFAVEGDTTVRVAAILALGEMRAVNQEVIAPLIDDPEALIGESALLCLMRSRESSNVALVKSIAGREEHPLAAVAADLIVLVEDPTASSPTRMGSRLLELRLLAAQRYGLVRGQAWQVLLLGELGEDEAFLDRVVYLGAAELHSPGVRDHFLEILLSGPRPGANRNLDSLRGAVNAIPTELSDLVDFGLWAPKDSRAWSVLLSEIDNQHLEGLTDAVLRTAWAMVPGLRSHASLLITRGGSSEGLPTLEMVLDSEKPPAQVRAIEALGGTGVNLYVKTFSEYLDVRSTKLATTALIGQVRLQFDEADTRLRRYFKEQRTRADEAAERGEYNDADPHGDELLLDFYGKDLVAGMCRTVRDPIIRELLLEIFPRLGGRERIRVATALASIGRPETRAVLLEHLERLPPQGAEGAERVRALAHSMTLEELKLMRELFPVEDDFEVNAELALALIGARDPRVLPLLRSALWREPLHRSLLAAALIADVAGVDALREELQHPSLQASERDLRRVGFALGEFGGLHQVEILSRRLGSGDAALQGALLGALAARTY